MSSGVLKEITAEDRSYYMASDIMTSKFGVIGIQGESGFVKR